MPWLDDRMIATFRAACQTLIEDGDVVSLVATMMPDHVHQLFSLGDRLRLDRVVAKFKSSVRSSDSGHAWQENYFEHRLRFGEEAEDYAWYMFMNPYCAGLISTEETWSGWWSCGATAYRFLAMTRPGPCPQSTWLGRMQPLAAKLADGE